MVANTVQSRKSKGRNLQKEVVACLLKYMPFLKESDVQSTSMGAPGVDVKLSAAAQEVFPFAIECKATEKFNLWDAWRQASTNTKGLNPIVIHRKNRTKAVAIVDLEYLVALHADNDALAKLVLKYKGTK